LTPVRPLLRSKGKGRGLGRGKGKGPISPRPSWR